MKRFRTWRNSPAISRSKRARGTKRDARLMFTGRISTDPGEWEGIFSILETPIIIDRIGNYSCLCRFIKSIIGNNFPGSTVLSMFHQCFRKFGKTADIYKQGSAEKETDDCPTAIFL